jgi:hypothetical protein
MPREPMPLAYSTLSPVDYAALIAGDYGPLPADPLDTDMIVVAAAVYRPGAAAAVAYTSGAEIAGAWKPGAALAATFGTGAVAAQAYGPGAALSAIGE